MKGLFDSGSLLDTPKTSTGYIALYSDTGHEVTEVTPGHRITVTYNLYVYANDDPVSSAANSTNPSELGISADYNSSDATLRKALLDLVLYIRIATPHPQRLGFGLQHQYLFSSSGAASSAMGPYRSKDLFLPNFHLLGLLDVLEGRDRDAAHARACHALKLEVQPRLMYGHKSSAYLCKNVFKPS